jgi:hypothetical protein
MHTFCGNSLASQPAAVSAAALAAPPQVAAWWPTTHPSCLCLIPCCCCCCTTAACPPTGGRLVANNTRIMPGETFGCAAHFFSPAARLEEVYAMHMFRWGCCVWGFLWADTAYIEHACIMGSCSIHMAFGYTLFQQPGGGVRHAHVQVCGGWWASC